VLGTYVGMYGAYGAFLHSPPHVYMQLHTHGVSTPVYAGDVGNGDVGEYNGDVGEYAGDVGEYAGEVDEYAGDAGEYVGDVGEYTGYVGTYAGDMV